MQTYREKFNEHLKFVRAIKDNTNYNPVISACSSLIHNTLLCLLEECGCTTPHHYEIVNLYTHCVIFIPSWMPPMQDEDLSCYETDFSIQAKTFNAEDVKQCVAVINSLIESINSLFYTQGIPLLEEI